MVIPHSQYTTLVKPAFEEFCLPTKKYADVIVPRGAENTVAIDLISQHMQVWQDLEFPCSHHQHPGYHLEKQQFPGSVSKRICQRPITDHLQVWITNLLQVWIEFQHRLGFQRPCKLKP